MNVQLDSKFQITSYVVSNVPKIFHPRLVSIPNGVPRMHRTVSVLLFTLVVAGVVGCGGRKTDPKLRQQLEHVFDVVINAAAAPDDETFKATYDDLAKTWSREEIIATAKDIAELNEKYALAAAYFLMLQMPESEFETWAKGVLSENEYQRLRSDQP